MAGMRPRLAEDLTIFYIKLYLYLWWIIKTERQIKLLPTSYSLLFACCLCCPSALWKRFVWLLPWWAAFRGVAGPSHRLATIWRQSGNKLVWQRIGRLPPRVRCIPFSASSIGTGTESAGDNLGHIIHDASRIINY